MAGRLGHIDDARRVGHVPRNGLRVTNYAYGFGGVTFWLDADFGTNTKTNGAAISSWTDRILNNNLIQSTGANQPLFISSLASFNNLPAIDFDATDSIFNSNNYPSIGAYSAIAWVHKLDVINGTGISNLLFTINGTTNTPLRVILGGGAGTTKIELEGILESSFTGDTVEHICVLNKNYLVIDGVIEDTNLTNTNIFIGFNGLGRSTFNNSINGNIGELLIWNNITSSDNMITICNNINSKYAIY